MLRLFRDKSGRIARTRCSFVSRRVRNGHCACIGGLGCNCLLVCRCEVFVRLAIASLAPVTSVAVTRSALTPLFADLLGSVRVLMGVRLQHSVRCGRLLVSGVGHHANRCGCSCERRHFSAFALGCLIARAALATPIAASTTAFAAFGALTARGSVLALFRYGAFAARRCASNCGFRLTRVAIPALALTVATAFAAVLSLATALVTVAAAGAFAIAGGLVLGATCRLPIRATCRLSIRAFTRSPIAAASFATATTAAIATATSASIATAFAATVTALFLARLGNGRSRCRCRWR